MTLTRTSRFLTGPGLPLFLAAATLLYELFIAAVLIASGDMGAWGAFSKEFKLWCFGYDPLTGGLAWSEVIVMQLEPIFVLGISIIVSRKHLARLSCFSEWRAQAAPIGSGIALAAICLTGLFFFGAPKVGVEEILPFPGERIRTALVPPEMGLTDQMGEGFDLEAHGGKVVLVTGVYALCGTTCPLILTEIRELLEGLEPELREQVQVAAITLNPENETPEQMRAYITGYGFEYPEFKYLNGDPQFVRQTLKRLQFSRTEYPEYGIIDHSNMFLLIDANGRIAYRLTLDDRHQSWLKEALTALAVEAREASVDNASYAQLESEATSFSAR